jgi:hypothetical protein
MLCGPEKSEDHLHEDSAFSFQPFLRSKPPTLWTAKKVICLITDLLPLLFLMIVFLFVFCFNKFDLQMHI